MNITKNLKDEQYKNKKLNDKLDNISIENNNNMKYKARSKADLLLIS